MKVLIVEDDQFVTDAYKRYFKSKKDIKLAFAENGKIGLDQVKTFNPDVILLDLVMPIMDGFTFLEELRNKGDNRRVIVASNLSGADSMVRVRELGIEEYFVKSSHQLSEIVQAVYAKR